MWSDPLPDPTESIIIVNASDLSGDIYHDVGKYYQADTNGRIARARLISVSDKSIQQLLKNLSGRRYTLLAV
jgi:hypothetical protein